MVDQCLNDVSLINFRLEDITSDENKLQQNSAVLCMVSYLMIAFIPVPALGILGCAVCGLSVGIMWPGTFSMAAASVKRGGTALFALLALAGDVGCSSGPTYVGMISGALNDNLKLGIFAALIFPVLMIMGIKMIGSLQKYDWDILKSMERLIFHIDVNSAFLSWESARRVSQGLPDLREIPSCVGGNPKKRTANVQLWLGEKPEHR